MDQKLVWLFLSAYDGGGPPKMNLFIRNCVDSYMCKLQSPLKFSPFDAIHLLKRFFSNAQNSFWTRWFWCFLVLLTFFCLFHLFHICKMFPFEDFFHRGNNKMWKVSMGEIRWTGRVGHTLVLVMNTQRGAGRCARKSPTMKWANLLRLQQKFTKAKHNLSQQNSSGYTDTDGFLEHSPRKKPVLKRLPSRR